jgi:hypothetical protein
MEIWNKVVERTAWSGVLLCAVTAAVSAAAAQQTSTPEPSPNIIQLPDSPGATLARLQTPEPPQAAAGQTPGAPVSTEPPSDQDPRNQQDRQLQAPQSQPQPPPQKPVGTAAAEPAHAGGIAASQPAGVAVAPVKQRRTRTIVIRTAAIIGAGVAVGSVVALTAGTSSKPPGAH